ncbi:aspartyl-phosphate phosphatase Spo0E family protein [Pullulanibacillus sp. KACC 23026]|nr:aspartyl-phosphate phosphatase Spo0E family protein [Pullulanibacillus sp. KACC 23026]WEG14881.1 aspartyl-phosphate phosphatase Spo0E family protein [Pullulanibacillus sp. KACC 23026]
MINLGLTRGLTDKETIKCSQSLDELLNIYRKQQATKKLTPFVS